MSGIKGMGALYRWVLASLKYVDGYIFTENSVILGSMFLEIYIDSFRVLKLPFPVFQMSLNTLTTSQLQPMKQEFPNQ